MEFKGNKWRVGAVLGAAFLLSACENPWREHLPNFDQLLSAGWLEDDAPLPVVPVYCYDTIGTADFYATPLDGVGSSLFRGTSRYNPNSPYAASKAAADYLV